jgi:hypothetical protein
VSFASLQLQVYTKKSWHWKPDWCKETTSWQTMWFRPMQLLNLHCGSAGVRAFVAAVVHRKSR